jgi:1-aminocyclopropane-1-carboxylate deaminase/D-cysteine desulfhydrase-like pyridoxal-dependent ACC family enzyme
VAAPSTPPDQSAPPPQSAPPRPSTPPAIAALPRVRLFEGPSPFHPLPRFSAALGGDVDVWIKREDLLPMAFGGNKLRNLEFLLGAARAEGADTLITSGRRWSNHCRLTAAAGAREGFDVHLVLSGPPSAEPGPNQLLDELFGATVHVAATADRADREGLVETVTVELGMAGRRPYAIGVGGTGVVGAAGQLLAGLELAWQASIVGITPAAIVVPTATGATQAGLLVGLALAGLRAGVLGIAATDSPSLGETVRATADGLADLVGLDRGKLGNVEIDPGQVGAGYAVPTPAATEAAELLARTEGLLVDPIYTAKGLAGLVAAVRDGRLAGGTVVFWHAGGLPGLFEPLGPAPRAPSGPRRPAPTGARHGSASGRRC